MTESERAALAAALGMPPQPLNPDTHPPIADMIVRAKELSATITSQRETERRHRDQRAGLCELLNTHWDKAGDAIRTLLVDGVVASDVRTALKNAGILESEASTAAAVRQLIEERRAASTGPDYSARLYVINEALRDAGFTPDGADPLDPLDTVKRLIEERRELLDEMAKAVPPEKLAEAVSDPPADPPLGPRCQNCDAVLCQKCNRCHGGPHTGEHTGCAEAAPPCYPPPAPAPADVLPSALRAAHDALVAVITASERDWSRSADLAWIYGVLVGWSEDDLQVLQINFGWRAPVVQVIDEHRAALVCAGMGEP